MNVSELTDELLDYWVAKAENKDVLIVGGRAQILYRVEQGTECYQVYSPSSDWSQGGPVIERELMKVEPIHSLRGGGFVTWNAKALRYTYYMEGETPLIAAMRSFVASKFGEEVDDSQAGE